MSQVRIKASRQPYRRAGLEFSTAEWVLAQAADLSDDQKQRLAADPVLTIEVRESDEDEWRRLGRPVEAGGGPVPEAGDEGDLVEELRAEIVRLGKEYQEDLGGLRVAHADALKELQKQLDEAVDAHQAEIDQLKADHEAAIAELKAAHAAELVAAAKPAEQAPPAEKGKAKETGTARKS